MACSFPVPSSDRSGGVRRSPDHQEPGHRPADQPADANHLAWLSILSLLRSSSPAAALRLFWTGKPATFYSENPVFQIKIGLFLALTSCLSYAAIFFNRHRKTQAAEISVPTTIRLSLRCAMLCLTLIPFLAWAMARGLGLSPN